MTTVQPSSRSRLATWPPPVATSSTLTSGPGSHHSTSRSRSGPSRCVGLSRNASARCDQTSVMRPAPPRAGPPRASSARRRGSGGAASARILRPSSAFVPSRRTTIGSSIFICSSAARIPRATSSQRVIPPKMLKKIERTWSSLVITSSASTTPWASPPPPRSQKFAGPPAGDDDHVHGRHRQTGAVAEDPDVTVELDVGDALLACEPLVRVGRLDVAHLGDVGVAVERAVVDRELRVERAHLAVRGDDERIDLGEHRVGFDEARVELLDDAEDLLLLARVVDRRRRRSSRRALIGLEPSSGSTCRRASASGFSSATCSISTPPSVVSMKSGCFVPRSKVIER